ncbi:MAG TPA: ATP-dependent helicase, partial [Candidatus Saccharimonadales bacterium]|nr:ATP-dependent helicase [Candidatus Saccharimonadales bacterium]
LDHDFPGLRGVVFTTNYRSAQRIVAVAQGLFGGELRADRQVLGKVEAVHVLNEFSESAWVLNEIQKAIGGSDLQQAVSDDDPAAHRSLRDFAVLYRSRSVARMLQRGLEESGLPYQVVGEGSPYDNPKVQVLIACLQHLAGDASQPVAGFSQHQLTAILGAIASQMPFEIASDLMNTLGYESTKALRHLLATLARFKTVAEAAAYFKAIGQQQFYDPKAEAVTLLTIHASKGLEFPVVFLLGCEDGVLPSQKGDAAEEKRLLYVAATRAKDEFYALHATMRHGKPATLSQFVRELNKATLPRMQDPHLASDYRRAQKRRAKAAQTRLF